MRSGHIPKHNYPIEGTATLYGLAAIFPIQQFWPGSMYLSSKYTYGVALLAMR